MIKLALLCFILLMIFLSIFLFRSIDKPFIIVSQQHLPAVQRLSKITAWLLLLVSFIGIILLFFAPLQWNAVTLILGSLVAGSFAFTLAQLT